MFREQYALYVKKLWAASRCFKFIYCGEQEYLVLETSRSVGKSASWSVGLSFI